MVSKKSFTLLVASGTRPFFAFVSIISVNGCSLISFICLIGPTNDSYPTEQKPLILFKEKYFQGSYIHGNPDEFKKFAANLRNERVMEYNSMRVLYNRTVIFSRNIVYPTTWTPGNDIEDLAEFMLANVAVADPIWYNYDRSIAVDFYAKVEGYAPCKNCSVTNGVCYTGQCVCMPGASGVNCDL